MISPFGRVGGSHVKEAAAPSVVALGVSTPSGTEEWGEGGGTNGEGSLSTQVP